MFVEPLLRADFGIVENYTPSRGAEAPLPLPILAVGARGDNRVAEGHMAAWASHTSAGFTEKPPFVVRALPWSTPHRCKHLPPRATRQTARLSAAPLLLSSP